MTTPAEASLRAARDAYYAANGIPPDGGNSEKWVRVPIGPFAFAFPNTDARRAVVPYHDLHHCLTGYGTHLLGEAEIGAWEIGSGMRSWIGVWLDLLAWGLLLLREPRTIFRAFVRGRHSGNLMQHALDDALLSRPLAEMRAELGLTERGIEASLADRLAFAGWSALAAAAVWWPLVVLPAWWLLG